MQNRCDITLESQIWFIKNEAEWQGRCCTATFINPHITNEIVLKQTVSTSLLMVLVMLYDPIKISNRSSEDYGIKCKMQITWCHFLCKANYTDCEIHQKQGLGAAE